MLEYARFIINGNNIEKNDGKQETFGFIINVAELFEIWSKQHTGVKSDKEI